MEVKLTSANFDKVAGGAGPVLIDCYASWCPPCRMIAPIISAVAQERPNVTVCKLNVDEEPAIASKFSVQVVPTLVMLKNGRVAARAEGLRPKAAVLAFVDGVK